MSYREQATSLRRRLLARGIAHALARDVIRQKKTAYSYCEPERSMRIHRINTIAQITLINLVHDYILQHGL